MQDGRGYGSQIKANDLLSYAAVATGGALSSSVHSTQSVKTLPLQAQREIIVSISQPFTVECVRAMYIRSLKSHIEGAFEQSHNEHITNTKTMSTNQLKSEDPSTRSATH